MLRRLGVAARAASGYLIQLKPDVEIAGRPVGHGRGFHRPAARCEAYLPGAGWVGVDPPPDFFAGEGHIPLACTANPTPKAAPISGAVEKSEVLFDFDMGVARVLEHAIAPALYRRAVG